jgi:hypothetical protein
MYVTTCSENFPLRPQTVPDSEQPLEKRGLNWEELRDRLIIVIPAHPEVPPRNWGIHAPRTWKNVGSRVSTLTARHRTEQRTTSNHMAENSKRMQNCNYALSEYADGDKLSWNTKRAYTTSILLHTQLSSSAVEQEWPLMLGSDIRG